MNILDTIFANQQNVIDPPAPVIGTTVLDREEIKNEQPKMYSVILLNDDFTPFWTVVNILHTVFNLNEAQANTKMMEAHRSGRSNVGTFSKDLAETKIAAAIDLARYEGDFPLAFDLQEEGNG